MRDSKSQFDKYKLSAKIKSVSELKRTNATPASTGFERLDSLLGGGLSPNLYVLGAISSIGKSTLLLQISEEIAAAGRPVLFFSLEMPAQHIARISISRRMFASNFPNSDKALRIGALLNKTELDGINAGSALGKALDRAVKECNTRTDKLYIIERDGGSIEAIRSRTEEFKRLGENPIVVVDYLQLLQTADKNAQSSERRLIDYNISQLWGLAHELDIPVIAVSSISREYYRSPRPLDFAAFKESGAIEFSADVLMGMQYRGVTNAEGFNPDYEKAKFPRELEIVILKNRYGISGDDARLKLDYYAPFGFFKEFGEDIKQSGSRGKRAGSKRTAKSGLPKKAAQEFNENADYED